MPQTLEILEGTWEEIAAHADEFKGRRLQLLIFAAVEEARSSNGTMQRPEVALPEESLAEAFARIGTIDGPPSDVAKDGKRLWGEGVEEKHRRIPDRLAERVAKAAPAPESSP